MLQDVLCVPLMLSTSYQLFLRIRVFVFLNLCFGICFCNRAIRLLFSVLSKHIIIIIISKSKYSAMAALVWLFLRNDLRPAMKRAAAFLVLLCVFQEFLAQWVILFRPDCWFSKFRFQNSFNGSFNTLHCFSKRITEHLFLQGAFSTVLSAINSFSG